MIAKKVLITAASSSIGKVITEYFDEAGYELVLHYHTIKPIQKAAFVQGDLMNSKDINRLVGETLELGPFDVVVNNAGLSRKETIKELGYWEDLFRLDTFFPALLMANGKNLVKKGGVFVNISSAYGHERFGGLDDIAYSASKAALNSLTRTYAKYLAPDIRVNAVGPGYVDSFWNQDRSEGERIELAKDHLTEKLVTKEQVASLVMEIVNNEGINGEIIYIDGGLTLKSIT